ncbi:MULTISPECIES: cell division protein [unclassified Novosphingobium]|uniref:cell division protein FtsX n=1 Tax=unclassified Novosphingobium TaxID=2644732 RepID=UPI0025E06478|nr:MULTISPECIES: cell division protein [unclassified Novosphingobium]HQV03747.1 cell division protein [Novosphingobium sp.]
MAFSLSSLTTSLRTLSRGTGPDLMPQGRLAGPMPWVIAIMVALTVIAAAAGLALSNTASNASDALSGGATVQVVEANPAERDRQAKEAARVLQATPGVIDVRIVSQQEVEKLIEPWLGVRTGEDGIPVPALVDVRLRDGVDGEKLGQLRRQVRQVAPAARVDAQSTWLKPVFSAIDSLQWLALALVALLGFALAAAVLLAVRTALGTNRETIEIVHLLGGTDSQIARIFQRTIGFDAAGGGAVGLGLGLVVVLLLGQRFEGLGAGLVDSGALDWIDWVLLALVPIAGVALAMVTARLTVIRALRKML